MPSSVPLYPVHRVFVCGLSAWFPLGAKGFARLPMMHRPCVRMARTSRKETIMAMYRNHRQPPKAWTAWLDGWTLDMQARGMSGQTVESYWYRVTSLHDRLRHTPEQGHGRADP